MQQLCELHKHSLCCMSIKAVLFLAQTSICSAGLHIMGFVAFPMPEIFPRHYWLFHSIWHVCLAAGYYELYALIEQDSQKGQTVRHAEQRSVAGVKNDQLSAMPKAASNSSLDSSSEPATIKHRVRSQVWELVVHSDKPGTEQSLCNCLSVPICAYMMSC